MLSSEVTAQLKELYDTLKDNESFLAAREELIEDMAKGELPYVVHNGNPYPLVEGLCELTGIEPMQVLDDTEFRALTTIMMGVAMFKVCKMLADINAGDDDVET